MPDTTTTTFEDGTTVIICSRGAARRRCAWCNRSAPYLCDGASATGIGTCDAPLCPKHATRTGPDTDLCPDHATRLVKEGPHER